jgi:hypothetical protein
MFAATLRAGATVALAAHPGQSPAVVVEVLPNGCVELDTGQQLSRDNVVVQATDETWTRIVGYGDRYLISSWGKVVSTCYHNQPRTRLLRVLRAQKYPVVSLYSAAGPTQVGLNRLVAQAFLPPPPASHTFVLPKDGNPLNLHADNLCWADRHDGADALVAQQLYRHGEAHHHSRLTTAQVTQVRALAAQGVAHKALATQFGVSRPTISLVVRGMARRTA